MFDPQTLKQQLAPLVEPTAITFWPPAPGWLVLIALGLAFLFWAFIKLRTNWQRRTYRRHAQSQLQKIWSCYESNQNDLQLVDDINTLLKRVAITGYPSSHCAKLHGNDWVDFLKKHSSKPDVDTALKLLGDSRYQKNFDTGNAGIEPKALYEFTRYWIDCHDA